MTIKSGPFAGLTGILVKRKNSLRFVMSVETIRRSITIEIEAVDLDAQPNVRTTNI